jgi:prophage tail gpP-like protein
MILTVSPVPLIATYVPRHVIVSTAYSKAVLRAAAEEVCERHALCTYFPSYEVITGSFNRGAYFDSDLRSVKPEGVDHVMRLFTSHYFGLRQQPDESRLALMQEHERVSKVVCDEEAIVREPALPASGSLRAIAGRLKGIAGLRR